MTARVRRLQSKERLYLAAATLGGIGNVPWCPGTAASLAAVGVFLLIKNQVMLFWFTLLVLILAFAVSGRAERIFGEKDCKKIVIDDFAGMLLSLLFIPREVKFIVAAFFLFRMLDMFKIPPADAIEKLKGAKAIVGDDIVAGIYANIALQAVKLLIAG